MFHWVNDNKKYETNCSYKQWYSDNELYIVIIINIIIIIIIIIKSCQQCNAERE